MVLVLKLAKPILLEIENEIFANYCQSNFQFCVYRGESEVTIIHFHNKLEIIVCNKLAKRKELIRRKYRSTYSTKSQWFYLLL